MLAIHVCPIPKIRNRAGLMKALTKERDELREAGNGTGNDWGCQKVWDMIWVNYNDLTATSLESWLVLEIIPKWP